MKLNTREKKLITFLALAIILLAHMILLPRFFSALSNLQAQKSILVSSQLEAASWLSDKEYWRDRRVWLDSAIQPVSSRGDADTKTLDTIQNLAATHHIQLSDIIPQESVLTDNMIETSISLKASGKAKEIISYIHALQNPEILSGIRDLTLKVENERTILKCEMHVVVLYQIKEIN